MMKLLALCLFISLSIFPQQQTDIPWPTLADSPWPMIKHDPQFTGRSPYKGPQTPTVIWTADLPNGIFSGPVLGDDNKVFFGSYYQDPGQSGLSDYFYCYDNDGHFLWKYKSGTSRPPQAGILIDSSKTIYFGSLDKNFYALDLNGTLKWRFETTAGIPELSMVNIDLEGNLYITNGYGELYSFNPSGQLNWNVNYESGFYGRAPVLSPDGQSIYIAGRDSNLFSLNREGEINWKFSCGRISKGAVADNTGNIYFLPNEIPQKLFSLTQAGNIRWSTVILDSSFIPAYSQPTLDSEGNISFALGSAILSYSYYGEKRWWCIIGNDPGEWDEFWQPLICDSEGTIYVGSTFGKNYYAITKNGELKWKLPLNDYQVDNTGAIAEDGTLYIGVHKSSLFYPQEKTLIAIKDTSTVSVNDNELPIPQYSLEQNYPNPFNPSTKISYTLKEEGNVKLLIYDIKGELISTLVNEKQQSGNYDVDFTLPGSISTGVYIYRLTVTDNSRRQVFADVKKMVYLK